MSTTIGKFINHYNKYNGQIFCILPSGGAKHRIELNNALDLFNANMVKRVEYGFGGISVIHTQSN